MCVCVWVCFAGQADKVFEFQKGDFMKDVIDTGEAYRHAETTLSRHYRKVLVQHLLLH